LLNRLVRFISPALFFDLFAIITRRHFISDFDLKVFCFIQTHFPPNIKGLNHLAFGLLQDESYSPFGLCFPSLISCIDDIQIHSDYDIYLFSKYGLDNWLKVMNKPINLCPFIEQISQVYVQKKYADLVMTDSLLFAKSCNMVLVSPKIEFLPKSKSSSLRIHFDECKEFTTSFWFGVNESFLGNGTLVSICSLIIRLKYLTLHIGKDSSFELFSPQQSHICLVIRSNQNILIYYNGKLKSSQKFFHSPKEIQFGSSDINFSWWIIGNVNYYTQKLDDSQIQSLFSSGPHNPSISPSVSLDYLQLQDVNKQLRIHPLMPLYSHIISFGRKFLFKRILRFIDLGFITDAQNYFQVLYNVQNSQQFLPIQTFSIYLATIVDICPQLFNPFLFILASKSFFQTPIKWNLFFFSFLRFGMLQTNVIFNLLDLILQKASELFSRDFSIHIFDFTLQLCQDPSIEDAIVRKILSIWSILVLPLDTISFSLRFLFSSPIFFKFLFNKFLDSLTISSNFDFLILMPPSPTSDIINRLLVISNFHCEFDEYLMICCLNHCSDFEIWNSILSIVTNSLVSIDHITFPQINQRVFHLFIFMFIILLRASLMKPEDCRYYQFAQSLFQSFSHFVPKILITKDNIIALSLLNTCGTFQNNLVQLPFLPFSNSIENESFEPYPDLNSSSTQIPLQTVHPIDDFKDFLASFTQSISFGSYFHNLNLSFPNLVEYNPPLQQEIQSNFYEHINLLIPNFHPTLQIPLLLETEYAFPFLASITTSVFIILNRIATEQPENLYDYFQILFYSTQYLNPKDQLLISKTVILGMIATLNNTHTKFPKINDFIFFKLTEGWFGSAPIDILSAFFHSLKFEDPHPFFVQFVTESIQYSKQIIDLLLNNEEIVLTDKFLFPSILPIFGKYLIQSKYQSKSFDLFIQNFLSFVKHSKHLTANWSINEISQNKFIQKIKQRATDFIPKYESLYLQKRKSLIISLLKLTKIDRTYVCNITTSSLNSISTLILQKQEYHTTRMRYIEEYEDKCKILKLSIPHKLIETQLSQFLYSEIPQSDNVSFSILSNQIYPTRFLEPSPLIPSPIEHHSFPSSYPAWFTENVTFPSLSSYSSFVFSKSFYFFSSYFPTSNPNHLKILSVLLGNFDCQTETRFLYGTIPISGMFLSTSTTFFFIEGLHSDGTFLVQQENLDFYQKYSVSGHFGIFFHYEGHLCLSCNKDQLIRVNKHRWLHALNAFEFTFLRGWTFILIFTHFNEQELSRLGKTFQEVVSSNLLMFPAQHKFDFTIAHFAYLLNEKLEKIMDKWANGEIDNYTYICLLNHHGLRSYCDFTQYPIFPWIVSNFDEKPQLRNLSLPMGQVTASRTLTFNDTFENDGYYYQTHYLPSQTAVNYLSKYDPFKFYSSLNNLEIAQNNQPLSDIQNYLKDCLTNPDNVSEIIPHLFFVPEIFSMKLNSMTNINLPSWTNNAYDFINWHSNLFQSPNITNSLPNWIDLIFGKKSRNPDAQLSKNLFISESYPPTTPNLDQALNIETQLKILNLGQCPRQIFTKFHPKIVKLCTSNHFFASSFSKITIASLNTDYYQFPISDIQFYKNEFQISTGFSRLLPPFFESCLIFNSRTSLLEFKFLNFLSANVTPSFRVPSKIVDMSISQDGIFLGTLDKNDCFKLYVLKYSPSTELPQFLRSISREPVFSSKFQTTPSNFKFLRSTS
jgi:hypothetical protein